jgi:ubiquinone/menaquinone biosynthesis C-methylase UbiE
MLAKVRVVSKEEYDQWFDSPEGRAIFETELRCLRSVCPDFRDRWIDVGVGTGRFASALGVQEGIDLSASMLEIAKSRGIYVTLASAERIPFPENNFDGILMALTLCFVNDAEEALGECRRVLRQSGKLLLGILPSDSPWGREYIRKAGDGHPI